MLSASAGLPDPGELSSKKSPTILCTPLLTCSLSHSTSTHCTFFFFLHFSCAFTFHEVVKHNMMKMLLFLSSSILKELQKNSPILGGAGSEIEKDSFVSLPGKWRHIRLLPRKTVSQKVANFDKFFKNCTLRWQLSQYNLIKLFRMKFKTTKLYYIRLMEKPKWTFWTTQKNFTGANFPFKTSFAASQKFQFIVFLFSVASRL